MELVLGLVILWVTLMLGLLLAGLIGWMRWRYVWAAGMVLCLPLIVIVLMLMVAVKLGGRSFALPRVDAERVRRMYIPSFDRRKK